jgi:hypothetical protein
MNKGGDFAGCDHPFFLRLFLGFPDVFERIPVQFFPANRIPDGDPHRLQYHIDSPPGHPFLSRPDHPVPNLAGGQGTKYNAPETREGFDVPLYVFMVELDIPGG